MADRYKSHFLASASHDLRQPLHALNLFVAQLQTEKKPAERKRLVSRIDAAVASMNELFEALLDMTKLEAGILQANPAEFAVQRLLDRIETTFAELADKKGLSLRVVPCSAWVRSDPILLERILFNLVGNAVRYTARGGVVVGCRRRATQLRIDVCDTGAGIPEDQRQSIFSEFYQLATPGPDRKAGLGLGLAIVDRLGRLLGHPVQLQSQSRSRLALLGLGPVGGGTPRHSAVAGCPAGCRPRAGQAGDGDRRRCACPRRDARDSAELGVPCSHRSVGCSRPCQRRGRWRTT